MVNSFEHYFEMLESDHILDRESLNTIIWWNNSWSSWTISARTVHVVHLLSGMLLCVKFRWTHASCDDREIINLIIDNKSFKYDHTHQILLDISDHVLTPLENYPCTHSVWCAHIFIFRAHLQLQSVRCILCVKFVSKICGFFLSQHGLSDISFIPSERLVRQGYTRLHRNMSALHAQWQVIHLVMGFVEYSPLAVFCYLHSLKFATLKMYHQFGSFISLISCKKTSSCKNGECIVM